MTGRVGAVGSGWSAGLRGCAYARVRKNRFETRSVESVTRSNHRRDALL